MKLKYSYIIMQGVKTASGCGDCDTIAYTSTLKEARKLFNKLKKDTKGWIKNGNNSYLETEIVNINDGCFNIIDCFKINL